MSKIPDGPFLTEGYSPRGGGIDFLGMRAVNLRMLQDFLIPGINNATSDFGNYCLATWIPWKFRQLAGCGSNFTLSRYKRFREAVEIIISHSQRPDSPANLQFGAPRRGIGVQQQIDLDRPLVFSEVERTEATSLFAAPLYGPSLRYLNLIAEHDAQAADLSSTHIPLTVEDKDALLLVKAVDSFLGESPEFVHLNQLEPPTMSSEALDELGLHGLHPSCYRQTKPEVKRAFLRRFVVPTHSGDGADCRRKTTRLVCETIRQYAFANPDQLTACWYSGLLPNGQPLLLADQELQDHRELWGLFQARQIQRTIAEVFLRCFELSLDAGAQSIGEVMKYWREKSSDDFQLDSWETFDAFVRSEATSISNSPSFEQISSAWHSEVHARHPLYDDITPDDVNHEFERAWRMTARWWIRAFKWVNEGNAEFVTMGDRGRMSLRWFSSWLKDRLAQPLSKLAEEIFSEIVYSQHIKVALSRFDGQVQRLRFTLGDTGLIPTTAAAKKLGQEPVRMADRLPALLGLLSDLDIITWSDGEPMSIGSNAELILFAT